MLQRPGAIDEAGITIAAHLTDLAALGLGARGDIAVAGQRRGLRAIRLKVVMRILEKRFTEPDFSAQKLAKLPGFRSAMSTSCLYEAGASFTVRLTELRLRQAAELLAYAGGPDQRHRARLRFQ